MLDTKRHADSPPQSPGYFLQLLDLSETDLSLLNLSMSVITCVTPKRVVRIALTPERYQPTLYKFDKVRLKF